MLQTQTTEELQNLVIYVSDKPLLPAFAYPGGYPITYYAKDMADVCPECANGGNGAEFQNPDNQDDDCPDDAQWILVAYDVIWEGPPRNCSHCNKILSAAYCDDDIAPITQERPENTD